MSERDLKILYANLMKEWDFDLNKEIKLEQLRPGSANNRHAGNVIMVIHGKQQFSNRTGFLRSHW